ncbi:MAG: leucine-rich repeat protein [Clostridiales bacterium]|nr:leucine-rich repeat protein [Clostridiales bacterium]
MKMYKKSWAVALSVIMLLTYIPSIKVSASESGAIGDNLTYILDDDGTLTISGTGDMIDYTSYSSVPWYSYRDNITSAVIKDGVTSIGQYAFLECTNLTSITYSGNIINIGDYAFAYCSKLTEISLSDTVESIGIGVFEGCSSLTNIYIDENNMSYVSDEGVLYNADLTEIICYPAGKTSTDFTIPNSVTSIGSEAFYRCSNLESITIPENVINIGNLAFEFCSGLESIIVPDSVTYIGNFAFCGCTNMINISLSNNITSLNTGVLSGCRNLSSVYIPNGITTINTSAFSGCTNLTEINIPDSIVSIGDKAFISCENLSEITITDNVMSISSSAFTGNDLTTVYCYEGSAADDSSLYPDGVLIVHLNGSKSITASGTCGNDVTYIFDSDCILTISGTGDMTDYTSKTSVPWDSYLSEIRAIVIEDGVTSIGNRAFYNCSKLNGITISDSVENIGDYAFYDCSRLSSIAIPNSVTSIGDYAFYDCSRLNSIEIPDSVTSIGDYVFYDCSRLNSVTLSDGIKNIGNEAFCDCENLKNIYIPATVESIGDEVFFNCFSLTDINVDEDNESYYSVDGILFNKDMTELIRYPSGKEDASYIIPDEITIIAAGAFEYCINLSNITIPDGIMSLGESAFSDCTNLSSITIPNGISTIEYCLFYGGSNLNDVIIPNSVTSIGAWAFSGCTNLSNITVPDGVTYIRGGAFESCISLSNITIPNSVTNIGSETFINCRNLSSITIPNSVTEMDSTIFTNSGLEVVYCYEGSVADDSSLYPDGVTIYYLSSDSETLTETTTETTTEETTETTTVDLVNINDVERADPGTASDGDAHTLWLVGDSTSCYYSETNRIVNRNGFGMALGDDEANGYTAEYKIFNNDNFKVRNLAASGRSSLDYLSDEKYDTLISNWQEGDYLIIAFGHNDEKNTDSSRFTDASMGAEGWNVEGQFAYSLYSNYILPAVETGVTPILATPITRRSTSSSGPSGSNIHDCSSSGIGDYRQTIIDLGTKFGISVIDNTYNTYMELISLGAGDCTISDDSTSCETTGYAQYHSVQTTGIDNTHTNQLGARMIAYFMGQTIKGNDIEFGITGDGSSSITSILTDGSADNGNVFSSLATFLGTDVNIDPRETTTEEVTTEETSEETTE